jgi:hypothetical protein
MRRVLAGAAILATGTFACVAHAQTAATTDENLPVADLRQDGAGGPDLSDYASPALEAGEHELLRAYLNALPREMKERIAALPPNAVSLALVDGSTNVIHYNHPEEAGGYVVVPAEELPGSDRPDFNSQAEARPETQNPGPYGGSGPYRRVYTVPLPAAQGEVTGAGPYYTQSGVLTTFCDSGHFNRGVDRGYAYMGGWSPTWNAVKGAVATSSAVDAGLIYNLNASDFSEDDYALFINVGNGVKIMSAGNGNKTKDPSSDWLQPPHIVCTKLQKEISDADTATIQFSVLGQAQLPSVAPECWHGSVEDGYTYYGFPIAACSTFGMLLEVQSHHFVGHINEPHLGLILWISPNVSWGGWAKAIKVISKYWNGNFNVPGYIPQVTCAGCIFKWMTSIAQTTQNLTDGAVYGAAWSKRMISGYALNKGPDDGGEMIPLSEEITDCSEYPLWNPPYNTKDYAADCKDSPSGLEGTANAIHVMDFDTKGEWDIIDLKP